MASDLTPTPKDLRIDGDANAGQVEVRYDEPMHRTLDEIVAKNATVHLEMMDKHWCSLMVYSPLQTVCFHLTAKKTTKGVRLMVKESWRESSKKARGDAR